MPFELRYNTIMNGAMTFMGNTIGLEVFCLKCGIVGGESANRPYIALIILVCGFVSEYKRSALPHSIFLEGYHYDSYVNRLLYQIH